MIIMVAAGLAVTVLQGTIYALHNRGVYRKHTDTTLDEEKSTPKIDKKILHVL